jgi:O-antigen/teichoic acid export membrane protein
VNPRKAGAMMSYAYTGAQIVVNLIYVPLLLGGIGQAEYGLYQLIGSIIAYLNVINTTLSAGVTRYYCKYYALDDKEGMSNTLGIAKRIYRWTGVAIAAAGVVFAIVMRLVYAQAFTPWEIDESTTMIAILVLNLIVTMNNTISIAVINAHEEFVFLKATMLATVVLQPFVVVLAMKWFPYALTVSIVQLVLNTVCRTVQHEYARRRLGMDTTLRFLDKKLERGLLHFSGGIVVGAVADQIFWKTDQLILGYLYGTGSVAVYAVGMQIVMAYMPIGAAVASVFMPRISDLYHKEKNLRAISDMFIAVGRIALYPLLLVLTGFVIFGQDFVRLWAGQDYGDAFWIALIVMVPFTIDIAQNIGLTILQVMDKYGFRAKMYLLAAILNIGLTVVLAQRFGGIGAATSSGIAMFVSSGIILNWYYATKIGLDILGYWKSVLRLAGPLVAVMAAFLVVQHTFGITFPSWSSLVVGIVLYSVLYALSAYAFSADSYERSLLSTLKQKLARR